MLRKFPKRVPTRTLLTSLFSISLIYKVASSSEIGRRNRSGVRRGRDHAGDIVWREDVGLLANFMEINCKLDRYAG
jgi:hypothetical protein